MSVVTTTADYHQHQYESWKRLVPYLYDWFANHSLVWPSLSCCWGARPDNLMDMVQENKNTSLQGGRVMPTNRAGSWSHAGRVHDSGAVLYLSEQTDGSVMNTLVMAYLDIPKKKGQYGGAAVNGSPPQQLHVAKTILHPGEVNKVVDIPQYPGVVVTHSDSAEVYVWNMNTQPDRVASPKDTEASVADVVLVGHAENAEFALGRSDVKALVASGGKDRNVLVWNIENVCKGGKRTTLSPDAVLEGHEDTVEDVAFKPGSCFDLASVADDSALILWDTRQTKFTSIVRDAHGKKKDVHCCDWSALTPTRLVTGAQDGSVHVWDTRKMETPVFEFRHHTQAVMNVAWSPHSKDVFATGSDDGLVCLWDVSRGGSGQQKNLPVPDELLLQHAGHQTSVVDFCWNPDEPWTIMSASVDSSTGKGGGTLQTWKVSDLVYKSEEQIMSELEPYRDYIISGDESQLPK